jgi:hypothetical protein
MASISETVAAQAGYDEDRWTNSNGKATFVSIPSTINGVAKKTRWWTSFWFNLEPNHGYYVWGYDKNNPQMPQFDSIFDPNVSVAEQSNGVLLRVKRNGSDAPYTAELVLEGTDPGNSNSRPGYGYYAVTCEGTDFGSLDPNVVLGIFTYQFGESAQGPNFHREIDMLETIDQSQQTHDGKTNAQFAIQPAWVQNGVLQSGLRFTFPKNLTKITCFMYWQMQSGKPYILLRIYKDAPSMDTMIKDSNGDKAIFKWPVGWNGNNPERLNERMHINFYVPNGRKGRGIPSRDQQVLITHFQYQAG